jgi:carboxyl-terminal processing protease
LANEKDLLEMEFPEFENNFQISIKMLNDLISIGEKLGAKYSEGDFRQSKLLLKGYMKAEIASLIWDEDGFYPIMNPVSNEIYNRALQLFDEASLLASAYNE